MTEMNEKTEIFRATLGSRMRMIRKLRDVTQDEAAKFCGVSPRSYKDYEMARRSVPTEVLYRYCEAFHVSPDSMFFGEKRASTAEPAKDERVGEVAAGVLSVFGSSKDEIEKDRQVKLACYAWQGAKAKGRAFEEELKEVSALMS